MELGGDPPPFNFPFQYGKTGKNRDLFSDYGITSFIDIDKDGEISSQRSKGNNHDKYTAVHPVLPLSCTAEKVILPGKDRIMGHIIERNKKLKSFATRVQKFRSLGKRWGKTDQIEEIVSVLEQYRAVSGDTTLPDFDADILEELTGVEVKPWFRDMLDEYTELYTSTTPQFNNYKYTGGCIDAVCMDDSRCYIVSAAGTSFNKLRLTCVSKKVDGLLQSFTVEEKDLPDTIYGVKSRTVQGQDFITVRTGEQCYLYKFTPDSHDGKLQMVHRPLNQCFESVDISPYIPSECVLVDETGECSLWCGDSFVTIAANAEPRFQVSDNWRHVQYGSHPRQVIYADQTAVQIFDLRTSQTEGVDLFSLPSKLLHNRERIRACGRHPASTFYHLTATDYNLMIMDERYTKYPVLKWEHMLSAPPQYMDSLCGSDTNPDDNIIYVASQYPADVHAFRFSTRSGLPPLAVSQPHRVAKITDISKWPMFVDRCPNTYLLHNRLNTSLAGISASPWQQGYVMFQLDSHGEIFHQVFSNTQSASDISFSAGQGSHDLKPLPVAVERATSWIESWGDMMRQQLSDKIRTRELQPSLLGIYFYRNPHTSCCICRPDLSNIPGGLEISDQRDTCYTCNLELKEGHDLINAIQEDGILASTSDIRPSNLKAFEELPKSSALSQLLMKDWYGDKESSTVEEILKNWDKEVIERRNKKKGKDKELPSMSEPSLMERLKNLASGEPCPNLASEPAGSVSGPRSGSSPKHSVTSALSENWEPSTASSLDGHEGHTSKKRKQMSKKVRNSDEQDDGQKSKKKERASKKIRNDETSSEKLPEKPQTSVKQGSKDIHKQKKRSRQESSANLSSVTVESEAVESVVNSLSDSFMSETFPIVHQEGVGTGLPMFTSLLAKQQSTPLPSPSKQQTTMLPSQSQQQMTPHSSQSKQQTTTLTSQSQQKTTPQRSQSKQQTAPHHSQSKQQSTPSKSKKHSQTYELTESESLFSNVESESSLSTVYKIHVPTPPSKKKSHKRQKKNDCPSESSLSIKTESEISADAGSEDLFDDSSVGVLESESDIKSPVLSIASCRGLLESQLSSKVSRELFSGQKSDRMVINRTVNSPRKENVSCSPSPRKPSQRKHLSGF